MTKDKIKKILELHRKWKLGETGGEYADLQGANLQVADLRRAKLQGADLRRAKLQGADLRVADLRGAKLRGANLQGANLDFSCWPLWCGTTNITIDSKICKQLVYHAICNMPDSDRRDFLDDPVAYANEFRRVGEVAKIKWKVEVRTDMFELLARIAELEADIKLLEAGVVTVDGEREVLYGRIDELEQALKGGAE